MRGTILAMMLCAAPALAAAQPPIAKLETVLRHPMASNGRVFEGYVYLYAGETGYFFLPRKMTAAEFRAADTDVMPGEGFDPASLGRYKAGDRVHIKARVEVDTACYDPQTTCAPFRKLILLRDLKIVR